MRPRIWALCLVVIALPLMASRANAACAPADLAGLWDAYAIGAGDAEPYWNRCVVSFNASARILSGSSCHTDFGVVSTLSGQLSVKSNCRVTGSFTQRFSGGSLARCTIAQATFSKDGEVVTGVGKCATGAIFSFDVVRR